MWVVNFPDLHVAILHMTFVANELKWKVVRRKENFAVYFSIERTLHDILILTFRVNFLKSNLVLSEIGST